MEAIPSSLRQDEAKTIYEKNIENIMNASHTQLVVATLLVTVTFAAGFTLPGGLESDPNSTNKGAAILIQNAAFCTFAVTNVIAFACSVGAIYIYSIMASARAIPIDYPELIQLLRDLYTNAVRLQRLAMVAVVIAFVAGLYATLAHSAALAIAICIIGCTSFFVFFWVHFRLAQYIVVGLSSAIVKS